MLSPSPATRLGDAIVMTRKYHSNFHLEGVGSLMEKGCPLPRPNPIITHDSPLKQMMGQAGMAHHLVITLIYRQQ